MRGVKIIPVPVGRRAALKAIASGAAAVAASPWLSDDGLLAFARIQDTNSAPKPIVFSASQFATLEVLVETIVPTDERSHGAKDARVADYIDLLVSESDRPVALQWAGGLALLDADATSRFGVPFVKLTPPQADTILSAISRNERSPKTALETFFVLAKTATINGYYTSQVGIQEELRYKGNTFLREFVGCQTEDGKDCPDCGQKAR